jgi:hypothetical protein
LNRVTRYSEYCVFDVPTLDRVHRIGPKGLPLFCREFSFPNARVIDIRLESNLAGYE